VCALHACMRSCLWRATSMLQGPCSLAPTPTATPAPLVTPQWGFKCTASDDNAADGITNTADEKCDIVGGQSGSAVWDPNTNAVRGVVSFELGNAKLNLYYSIGMTQVRPPLVFLFLPQGRWNLIRVGHKS
jgi:hypothetical protein